MKKIYKKPNAKFSLYSALNIVTSSVEDNLAESDNFVVDPF